MNGISPSMVMKEIQNRGFNLGVKPSAEAVEKITETAPSLGCAVSSVVTHCELATKAREAAEKAMLFNIIKK